MKIATFNVNGINGRLPVLLRWLESAQPDVVCLQELKAPDAKFPVVPLQAVGYRALWHGQKGWNGVAILTKGLEPVEVRRSLPDDEDDEQSRYLEADVGGTRVACIYLPNGNPAPGPKFDYKLQWLERLGQHARSLLNQKIPAVIAGDFNVIPTELDVYKPGNWVDDALFRTEVRTAFAELLQQGWTDAVRHLHPDKRIYTFWDYLRNSWPRDAGLRLDHFLLSPELAKRLVAAEVDREVRGWEHASDDAPVWIQLDPAKKPAPKKKASAKKAVCGKVAPDLAALGRYADKRDFEKTPEPPPGATEGAGHRFVVQEHHARSHHFDLRLEMDGVLVSWAVPKGIPEDCVSKRLAVHTEDHPLEYATFEGVIPKGNYGAGKVMLFDHGKWEPIEKDWRRSYAKGTLKFHLKGDRLNGPYLLTRMREEPNWMLKMLNPATHATAPPTLEREVARYVSPQLARVVPAVPSGGEWIHELKYDGYRLVAVQHERTVRMFTRNGLDWTDRFHFLARALSNITEKDFVVDGEAVVFDKKGRSSFSDLQAALQAKQGDRITFVAFDIMHCDGINLRELPLAERLNRLETLIGEDPGVVMRSKVWPAENGRTLFEQSCENGLEGIISKNLKGRYIEGTRRDWCKSKCRPRQEFVICGYTPPKSSLPAFGALVLASFENGKLVPRGRVGTGFSDKKRRDLLEIFKRYQSDKPLWTGEDPDVVWMSPELVAEVEFAELTRDGSIRQGSFIGLREDKTAAEVHLDALQMAASDARDVKVAGILISHPDRLVFPADQVTKVELAQYYERVGELMLPFVANRPLAVIRAPEGITGEMFFQKSFPNHVPSFVYQRQLEDGQIFSVKDVKGLVALAQFGVVEFHPWGAKLPKADKPDFLTWDLDPDDEVPWNEVLGAALLLRDFLADRGLSTLVKTSGGKGLHILLHLKPAHGWEELKALAKGVAAAIAAYNPTRLTITSTKSKRKGRIYIDWMRNGRGATCVAPWGLRARPGAPVSMPVQWSQLPEITADEFTIHHPPQRPAEWLETKPQTISKQMLREF